MCGTSASLLTLQPVGLGDSRAFLPMQQLWQQQQRQQRQQAVMHMTMGINTKMRMLSGKRWARGREVQMSGGGVWFEER